MRLVQVYLPEPLLDGLDYLVKLRLYPHRSEAIRVAVKDLLDKVRRPD